MWLKRRRNLLSKIKEKPWQSQPGDQAWLSTEDTKEQEAQCKLHRAIQGSPSYSMTSCTSLTCHFIVNYCSIPTYHVSSLPYLNHWQLAFPTTSIAPQRKTAEMVHNVPNFNWSWSSSLDEGTMGNNTGFLNIFDPLFWQAFPTKYPKSNQS